MCNWILHFKLNDLRVNLTFMHGQCAFRYITFLIKYLTQVHTVFTIKIHKFICIRHQKNTTTQYANVMLFFICIFVNYNLGIQTYLWYSCSSLANGQNRPIIITILHFYCLLQILHTNVVRYKSLSKSLYKWRFIHLYFAYNGSIIWRKTIKKCVHCVMGVHIFRVHKKKLKV